MILLGIHIIGIGVIIAISSSIGYQLGLKKGSNNPSKKKNPQED